MKIVKSIKWTNQGKLCRSCMHFQNDPSLIEKTYPGLVAMGSGFASVRDQDGFCGLHQLYLSARESCNDHTIRTNYK
jgi:hypothetical protein